MASQKEDTFDTSMVYKAIRTKISECGTIHSVIINRPKKMNAVSFEAMHEIRHYLENHINPFASGARVVVFYGEGKHFTAGLDLGSAADIGDVGKPEEDADVARKSVRIYDHVLWLQDHVSALEKCRVPVICAITGYCIGAGVDLSSACCIRLASKDAKFTIKEVDIGLAADIGTLQRFQKVIGNESWARELAYTARYFGAEEALSKGFLSSVYETRDQCLEAAYALAKTIASKSPVAVNATKKSIIFSRDHSVAEGLNHIALMNGAMLQTSDSMTAVTATMTKTPAKYAKL